MAMLLIPLGLNPASGMGGGGLVEEPVVVAGTPSPLGRTDMSTSGDLMCSSVPTLVEPGEVSSLVDSIELATWNGEGWTSLGLVFEWEEPWKHETCSIAGGLVAAHRMEWHEPASYGVTVVRDGHVYVSGGNVAQGSVIVMRELGGPERTYGASYWSDLSGAGAVAWSEPGLLQRSGVTWLTLTRQPGGDLHLFRSLDGGVGWEHQGLLLPGEGSWWHGASNLFHHGGKVWMNTTPRGQGVPNEGAWIWRVVLNAAAAVKSHEITFSDPGERGTAAWHEGSGYLVHRIVPPAQEPLRAYAGGELAP